MYDMRYYARHALKCQTNSLNSSYTNEHNVYATFFTVHLRIYL
jgi:hypothetical protein